MDFRVKEHMSREIKSVSPGMNAKEALKLLLDSGSSGMPVIDEKGSLVGVFTEKEVLKAVLPAYVKAVGTFVYADDSKAELKKMANLEKFAVKDLMRKEVPTLDEDASLTEASKIMLTKSERRIVVVSKGRPAGVITRSDVVRALAKKAGVEF